MLGGKGSVFCRSCCAKVSVSKWNDRTVDKQLAAAKAEISELKSGLRFIKYVCDGTDSFNKVEGAIYMINNKHKDDE